ncbi:zinc finger-like domain-containing protein [Dolichospermum sp. ST_sed9]|nr:zinc finger-like domain-containing protein [Dolichospermum sp. ST_sed9]
MIETTLGLLIVIFSLTLSLPLIFAIIHGLINGASINELIQTRFYELFPVRIIFWTLFGILGYGLLVFLFAGLSNIYNMIINGAYSSELGKKLLLNFLFESIFGLLLLFVKNCLLAIPNHHPIPVKNQGVTIRYGIAPRLFKELGSERFPNEISTKNSQERIVRWIIFLVGLFCVGLVVFMLIKNDEYSLKIDFKTPIIESLSYDVSWQKIICYFLFLTVPTLIILLLFNNRDYRFIPFSNSLIIKSGFLIISILCLTLLNFSIYTVIITIALIMATYGFRAIADLTLESTYKRIKQVYNPIATTIKQHTPYLDQILDDPHLKLGSLENDLLINRISQGCRNVEERGVFVTQNFARFLNLVEIQYQEFAVAMLRYLTVRRYITLSSGSGTSRWLQQPIVPMTDLQLFPLNPPSGYVNRIDPPLMLPSQWDVVKTCGTCSGKGTRRVRRRSRTCSTCGGRGRLEYTQILNTQWQRLLPLITHPNIPVPELVEDAEEQVIFDLPLTENFTTIAKSARIIHPSTPLAKDIYKTGNQLEKLHNIHSKEVEALHNGSLYRADFQIASFRTIMIEFVNLGGRIGWFFGRRPEFYFPRLPLCYTTILTIAVLPPLWLTLFLLLLVFSNKIFPLLT